MLGYCGSLNGLFSSFPVNKKTDIEDMEIPDKLIKRLIDVMSTLVNSQDAMIFDNEEDDYYNTSVKVDSGALGGVEDIVEQIKSVFLSQ